MAFSSWQRRSLGCRHRHGIIWWLSERTWQLSGATALVSAFSFCVAAVLSFFIRPRRPYFFPLLSDISAHDPERAILHLGLILSTMFLLATTIACWKRAAMLEDGSDDANEEVGGGGRGNAVGYSGRRVRVLGVTSGVILMIGLLIMGMFTRSLEIVKIVGGVLTARRLDSIVSSGLAFVWFTAISYLSWFFFKLETIPDHDSFNVEDNEGEYDPIRLHGNFFHSHIGKKFHEYFLKLILFLRPLCFTGQVVCLIKIAGLRLALNRFTISKRRLIRLALQTALAFTEYTAVFFFFFFMIMLTIDVRNKFKSRQELPIGGVELGSPMVAKSTTCTRSPVCR